MSNQPILRFIEGIDKTPREMTDEEINQLTSQASGQGDWFAQWLAKTPVPNRQLSLRALLKETLPSGSYYMPFAVADGTPLVYDHKNEDNPLNSVNRHLRFVIIALPDSDSSTQDLSEAILKRTLCIVGSNNLDGKGEDAFLQCASWDPDALGRRKGLFRFFQRLRETGEWVYSGDSFNAFNAASINCGPFDGHIGGALIMKELTTPWTHWYNVSNANEFQASLGSTRTKPSLCDPYNALYDPLFTPASGAPLSLLGRAEGLEPVVRTAVYKWYASRFSSNFIDSETKQPFKAITSPIKEWVSHILLNKSINIAACATSTAQVQQQDTISTFPMTLFVNLHALQTVLPEVGSMQWNYNFQTEVYTASMNELQSSLYYDDFSTYPPTRKLAVEGSEGPFPFPIIEPGIEDYQGVATLNNSLSPNLLPSNAIAAMLMIDFWNPVYSLARYELMKYLPDKATYDEGTQTYDVLPQFVSNVQASPASKVKGSPEQQILALLNEPNWETAFTGRVNKYLNAVKTRLSDPNSAAAAVQEYMVLAEGRRRLYKGWEDAKPDGSGLDEFRMTLPIAAKPDPFPPSEMTEKGDVVTIPAEKLEKIIWYRWGGKQPERRKGDGHSFGPRIQSTGGCPAYASSKIGQEVDLTTL